MQAQDLIGKNDAFEIKVIASEKKRKFIEANISDLVKERSASDPKNWTYGFRKFRMSQLYGALIDASINFGYAIRYRKGIEFVIQMTPPATAKVAPAVDRRRR